MSRALIGSAAALLLALAGCGGGSDDAGKRKTACAKAQSALTKYKLAGEAVGTNFFNRAGDERVIAAAAAMRARLQALEPLTSAQESARLQGLARALETHEKLLGALAKHDLPVARKYATIEFERELDKGKASFAQICKASAS
jgi:hypothetical protein